MTAVGAEVVLTYGYPKVHGEKNVFYDFRHSDPTIAINENDDAYAGASSWGQYYYSIIGHKLAGTTDDIYTKTGIFRSTYAIAGLLGMLVLAIVALSFVPGRSAKQGFIVLFLLFSLISISQTLYLREVRYYSLALLLSSLIIGLYIRFRFYRPFNKIVFVAAESVALWCAFVTWSPLFMTTLFCMGVSELFIFVARYKKTNLSGALQNAWPLLALAVLAIISIIPMIIEFKYFEIATAMNEFFGYNADTYKSNLTSLFGHFQKQELLLVAVAAKLFLLCSLRKIRTQNPLLFKVSAFLTLYLLVSCLIIARIPTVFARYLVFLQPVLSVMIILDLIMIVYAARSQQANRQKNSKKAVAATQKKTSSNLALPVIVLTVLFLYSFFRNIDQVQGHIYEMNHQYKGPLDYTIPYIQEHSTQTDTLVIAANYEEYSYMYYLNSKVIVGYTGNNLEEDAKLVPDIIAYRKGWQNHLDIFNGYFQKAKYRPVSFPVYDNPVNNIPEFNFLPDANNQPHPNFNHKFRTSLTNDPKQMTYLYIKE
jgi:hypothetical protein